jgi:hypothetical protein
MRIAYLLETYPKLSEMFIVSERDVRGIADAMETLILQPQLRQRLGENGKTKVLRRFALEASARRVHDILLHAAAQSPEESVDGAVMPEARRYDADLPRPTPTFLPVEASRGAHG